VDISQKKDNSSSRKELAEKDGDFLDKAGKPAKLGSKVHAVRLFPASSQAIHKRQFLG